MLLLIDYKSEKFVFNKCLYSLEFFGKYTEVAVVGCHFSYRSFHNKNEALEYFIEKTNHKTICFIKDYVSFNKCLFEKTLPNISDAFYFSHRFNNFPVQSAFITTGLDTFGEDPHIFHCTKPQTSCVFATRDIVKKTGYFDKNDSLILWQARANTLAGRYPEDFIVLKHSYRYITPQTNCTIQPEFLYNRERLSEIYKGNDLQLSQKY